MSEDAPVNTGVAFWPDPYSAGVAVRSMQTKLHLWAARDAGRRFGDLFNLVYDPAFLVVAWERVSTNKGASTPGIDKATAAGVEARDGVIGLQGGGEGGELAKGPPKRLVAITTPPPGPARRGGDPRPPAWCR